jgi:hypothetical protein
MPDGYVLAEVPQASAQWAFLTGLLRSRGGRIWASVRYTRHSPL